MMAPEIDGADRAVDGFTDAVRERLRDHGCVLLRRALAPERCHDFADMFDRTFAGLAAALDREGVDVAAAEAADARIPGAGNIAWNLKIGQIMPNWFEQANPGLTMFDLLDGTRFPDLLGAIFGTAYRPSPEAHARRVSPRPDQQGQGWQEPIHFHIDAQYHMPQKFGVNVWVPVDGCGVDAPGMQVVLEPLQAVIDYVGYDPAGMSFDTLRLEAINSGAFLDRYAADRLYRPQMALGDVLLMHNWTLHGTYCTPDMVKARRSFELRFHGEEFLMGV
jgi:hypothetical protein